MNVEAVYWPRVVWISSNQPLSKAACRMREFDVGCVLVLDEASLVGIVTEHDLLRAAAEGIDPKHVIVRDYMTSGPVSIDIDDDVAAAAAVMTSLHARHLPVVERGQVVGVVSARDLLALLAERTSAPAFARSSRSGSLNGDRLRIADSAEVN
jgi:CBS domain-containing protein